jgi:hypothetical protein
MRPSRERQLAALEDLYRELLLAALRNCARGRYGLFARNDHALSQYGAQLRARLEDPAVAELLDLGAKIDRLRHGAGLEPFQLHERLLKMRSSHDSNTPGEPKLARQWLDELT